MLKKVFFFIGFLIIITLSLSWWYLSEVHAFRIHRSIYHAIPETASLFVEAKSGTSYKLDLLQHTDVDTLINSFEQYDFELSQDRFIIMAHTINHQNYEWAYIFNKKETFFEKIISGLQARYNKSNRQNDKYMGFSIEKVNIQAETFCCVHIDDLFIVSKNRYLMEVLIDHVLSHTDIRYQNVFKEVYRLSNKSDQSLIYINHKNFPHMLNRLFSSYGKSFVESCTNGTSWTALDIVSEGNYITLNGYLIDDEESSFLLDKLSAEEFTIYESFPEKLSFFYWAGINNSDELFTPFSWLNFSDYIQNELSLVKIGGAYEKNYFLLEIDPLAFKESILNQGAIFIDSSNLLSIPVYKMDSNHLKAFKMILSAFPGFEKLHQLGGAYFGVLKNTLVISDQLSDLSFYFEEYAADRLISRDIDYIKFMDRFLSSRSNMLAFVNGSNADESLNKIIKEDMFQSSESINIRAPMSLLELNHYEDKAYMNLIFSKQDYKSSKNEFENRAVYDWPHSIITQPTFVKNHLNGKKEIIFQDEALDLCLLNINGEVIWKARLKEVIKSPIRQIDYLGNKKLQYIFNTDNFIYMLDRNANLLDGFPIKLKEPSTNDVFYVDYERDYNYRFFISGNMGVYGYSKKGKLLKEWSPAVITAEINKPLKHMSVSGKDYLIITDTDGNLILKDRRAKNRISPVRLNTTFISDFKADFAELPFKLINADTSFNIIKVYLNGKLEKERIKPISYFDFKYFDYVDIDGDNKRDYLFMDDKQINGINRNNEFVISYKFPEKVSPICKKIIYRSDLKYLGVLSEKTQRIYLLDNNGTLVDGFPVDGRLFLDYCFYDNNLHLITLGGMNKIYLYTLEL